MVAPVEASGQHDLPAALPPGKKDGTH